MDSTIIDNLQWFVTLGAVLLLVGSISMAAFQKMSGRPASWGPAAASFVVAAGAIALPQVMRMGEAVGEENGPDKVSPPPGVGPVETLFADLEAALSDAGQLLTIVGVAALVCVVCGIGLVIFLLRGKSASSTPTQSQLDREREAETARLWDRHVSALNELKQSYLDFETDPWSAFRRPLLGDVSEPATAAFHEAFAHAQDLHTSPPPASRELVDEFGAAVRAAARAWEVADQHAREIAVPTTTDTDRRRLRQAEDALRLALDERASAAERRAALGRVEELIKGLAAMTPKARTTIVAELDHVERQAIIG